GFLVSLPTSQQCQQPTVCLALDRIHHLARTTYCSINLIRASVKRSSQILAGLTVTLCDLVSATGYHSDDQGLSFVHAERRSPRPQRQEPHPKSPQAPTST